MQNPFSNPAFSMANLTAAINLLPNRYGRLESLNLFPVKPVRFRQILLEEKNGVLNLLPLPMLDGGLLIGQHRRHGFRQHAAFVVGDARNQPWVDTVATVGKHRITDRYLHRCDRAGTQSHR